MLLNELKKELRSLANCEKAKTLSNFFKTGKNQYGEGDKFLGITVPQQRIIAKKYKDLSLTEIKKLLYSKYHEERLTSLLILERQYFTGNQKKKEIIYNFYIKNIQQVNNWDLVDLTAYHIVGDWLFDKDRKKLFDLAKSNNLWQRRIAVVATFYFIRQGDYNDTLKLAEKLLNDSHDLIHKAVGWMLREIGKNCGKEILINFLNQYYQQMPRSMLRYAIEKLPSKYRFYYLKK